MQPLVLFPWIIEGTGNCGSHKCVCVCVCMRVFASLLLIYCMCQTILGNRCTEAGRIKEQIFLLSGQ